MSVINDLRHALWLVYINLKDADATKDPELHQWLLTRARQKLTRIIHELEDEEAIWAPGARTNFTLRI